MQVNALLICSYNFHAVLICVTVKSLSFLYHLLHERHLRHLRHLRHYRDRNR